MSLGSSPGSPLPSEVNRGELRRVQTGGAGGQGPIAEGDFLEWQLDGFTEIQPGKEKGSDKMDVKSSFLSCSFQ